MNLFDALNDAQIEAVKNTEGYVRVIAGAGSGKTRVLTSRYVYLVKEYGIDPSNILCVTFTNKAANEMKNRIKLMVGETCNPSLICTYHGLCVKIIKENPEKLFLPNNFQIIDDYQQKKILSDIYQKHELKLDYASFERTIKNIIEYKNTGNYVEKFINPGKTSFVGDLNELDNRIIEEYLQKQKDTYSLDFEDLINFATYLLKNNEEIRTKWQKRLNYIQVDEFQDSSKKEMELIDILSAYFKNVLIVGDPDQNIYEWRGSDVSLLIDFDKSHIDTKTIYLNQNYRSTTTILNCANSLIDKNEYRLKKDLYTNNGQGLDVDYYHSSSDDAETDRIVSEIRKATEEKYNYDDIAILYRSNYLSRIIEKKLVEDNIPYEIYGGVKFYQRMEIQDILAYLKVIAYNDDISLKRIINTPRRKFGRNKLNFLLSIYEKGSYKTIYDALLSNIENDAFKGSHIDNFISSIEEIKNSIDKLSIAEIVEETCFKTGYEEYIRSLGDNERLENLSEFKRIANEFEDNFGEKLTLNEFLQQISLQTSADEQDFKNKVKLMTIHTAKGLEFPIVFIVGLTEGIFPSSRTIEERKQLGLEEERRLCYVAITRAKEKLYLMESEGLSNNYLSKYPSRFLEEIGIKNYITHGTISDSLKKESREYRRKLNNKIRDNIDFMVGETVKHHIFGEGTILEANETKRSYLINFGNIVRNISYDYFSDGSKDIEIPEQPINPDVEENNLTEDIDNDNVQTIESYDEDGVYLGSQPIDSNDEILDVYDDSNYLHAKTNNNDEEKKQVIKTRYNLWKRTDVPHSGWTCLFVEDLKKPSMTCEMCQKNIIRYAHHMTHPNYDGEVIAGCICAGKMEGDLEAAKLREKKLKRRNKNNWKKSSNGNYYFIYNDHIAIVYKGRYGSWSYSIDDIYSNEWFKEKKDAKYFAIKKVLKL